MRRRMLPAALTRDHPPSPSTFSLAFWSTETGALPWHSIEATRERELLGVNHTSLAREALRFRLASVHRALDPSRFDLDGAAAFAVSCGDPVVDSAIRRVGTAWLRAGLDPESIIAPWTEANGNRLLEYGGFDVIDALDDIVRTIKTYAVFTSAELAESPPRATSDTQSRREPLAS